MLAKINDVMGCPRCGHEHSRREFRWVNGFKCESCGTHIRGEVSYPIWPWFTLSLAPMVFGDFLKSRLGFDVAVVLWFAGAIAICALYASVYLKSVLVEIPQHEVWRVERRLTRFAKRKAVFRRHWKGFAAVFAALIAAVISMNN